MAQGSRVVKLDLEIADADRAVYVTESIVLAQHPSEDERFLVTRAIAYALHHREGLAFGRGISAHDEPALWVRELDGRVRTWIDVGSPPLERIRRACHRADRVVVVASRDARNVRLELEGATLRKPVDLVVLEPAFVERLAAKLDKRNAWIVTRTEGRLYVTVGADTLETDVSIETFGDASR
jgi:uncharacterized protein YaeQ